MAPKFALFTKGSKLPLNKGFKNIFEFLQSCAQTSNFVLIKNMPILPFNVLTFYTSWAKSADKEVIFLIFTRKYALTFRANYLLMNTKAYFLGKIRKMVQNIIC